MQQAGTYGGGYMPPGQNYASTAPPSYNMDAYGVSAPPGGYGAPSSGQAVYGQGQEPAYLPQESTYPAQDPAYNPNSAYAPPQPSYAPAVPSYTPGAPSYDYYTSSAPPSSTPPAQGASYLTPSYSDGGYGGLQSYGSGGSQGAPVAGTAPPGYQQVGFDQSGYGRGGYEQGGYGSQGGGVIVTEGRGYERDGYGSQGGGGAGYSNNSYDDGGYAEVYAYDGGQAGEPYGARGTGGGSWGTGESRGSFGSSGGSKVARAVPKTESDNTGGGIQKYRVKLLSDMSSSTAKDVICQIGLDGVRMLDPSTSRILRIYPLETITRWEVNEPAIFTFWAKSSVDIEQRCIRLQSSQYTTSAILDTITAACVQLCEMVDKDAPDKSSAGSTAPSDTGLPRKSSIVDWVSLRPRALTEEEKQHWVPDEAATKCSNCDADFSAFVRRHHCRNCGDVFCDRCTRGRTPLTSEDGAQAVRVCDRCLAEVTQRLSNAKEVSKVPVQRTHEDLAKKLQEELERNAGRRDSGGSKGTTGSTGNKGSGTSVLKCSKCGNISLVSGGNSRCPTCGTESSSNHVQGSSYSSSATQGSGPRMREVACPTCTVHLQVQVPSSGTETVECGVCQHPFLVSA
ncbi:hypothetical protein KC19_2G100900 [Ceratodon purpureus]|uniref:FYVE-type domain-containing protein n=1 Tax=Ceratodon purpureus TaxID=3225 RepID=A0A8T0IU01_CERPU|nr:hypothetical protein KC19_2G100900 [Ceratodon purpureus]